MAATKRRSRGATKGKQKDALRIERVPTAKINAAPYNPRKRLRAGDAAYEALKRSIKTWGYVDPLVWNQRTGNLVGGHQRYNIMVEAFGATELDVSVVDLDATNEKALNVALNKVQGEWDQAALVVLMSELQASDLDATLTGFDESEIAAMLAEVGDGGTELRELDTQAPPTMAWVLVAIPLTRFTEIAELVEKIAAVPGVLCETTCNDG